MALYQLSNEKSTMKICKELKETEALAAEVAEAVKEGGIVYLYGDLGSGKTAFAKGMAKKMGIDDFSVKSPTFNYIRRYGNFYHVDLYRLEEIDELLELELKEAMNDKKNILVIEWADRLENSDFPPGIKVKMEYISEKERGVEVC